MAAVAVPREGLATAFGPQCAWAAACGAFVLELASVGTRAAEGRLGTGAVFGIALLVLPLSGAIVLNQQPWNTVGWLLVVTGLAAVAGTQIEDARLAAFAPSWRSPWLALASDATWPLGFPLLVAVLLLVFPDGTTERRWRWPLRLGLAGTGLLLAGVVTRPWDATEYDGLVNPLAVSAGVVPAAANTTGLLLVAAAGAAGIVRLARLYRSGQAEVRAQIRVLLAVAASAAVSISVLSAIAPLFGSPAWLDELLPGLVVIGFPAAVAYAVTRQRLYRYSVVVDGRAIVTVVGLAIGAAAFALTAGLLLLIAHGRDGAFLVGAVATICAVAAGLGASRSLGRRRKGPGADPRLVLRNLPLGDALEPKLDEWVDLIRDATRAPAVELKLADRPAIRSGGPVDLPLERFELGPADRPYGELIVSQRSPSERYDSKHLQLLTGIAQLISGTIDQARATHEAQESRRALAESIAAERERLHGDVHDQLGPRLAGIGYLLAAVDAAPDGADHLARARSELLAAAEDARRIAHDLQPRPIEQLGLGEAIRQHAVNWADASGIDLDLDIDPFIELADPQATAVYSVALEAMTNVGRHARASRCAITLHRIPRCVTLSVQDDGVGVTSSTHPGLGVHSMRRRAAELGGTLAIESHAGTTVRLQVPLDA